jgi:predicted transcriptional regulator
MSRPQAVPGLGPLESAIMLVVWDAPIPLKVAEVKALLAYPREPAYTTVMTVLEVLNRKALLHRHRDGRPWRYFPALSRDDYIAGQVRELVGWAHDPAVVIQTALGPPPAGEPT